MIDRSAFFAGVRMPLFGGRLTLAQVDGMNRILDEWDRRALTDLRWLAYMLATVFHETGRAMQPVREGGGEAYLRSKRYYPWVGEGLVQVTWEVHARKFGAEKPGDCMSWPVALRALFDGMIGAMFTRYRLADFFGPGRDDPTGARRIINGTDKAAVIAGHHRAFLAALHVVATPAPVPAAPAPAFVPPTAPAASAPAARPGVGAWLAHALFRRSA